jgi:translation initiation factor 3 subunit J|tara:strand:+ start:211 stop:750 length:540 start_codon:yes stop_codon:yes gene_type:complete
VAKKPEVKKKTVAQYVDETLDDPVAEKARRQKLVEEADLAAAKELFGTDGEEIDLTTYNPKSAKEFTKFGTLLASKFLIPIKESAFFKETIKAFVKSAMKYMTVVDIKEVEATVVAMRNEKVKAEKAEAIAAQKATAAATAKAGKGKKKFLNQGTKGGDDGLSDFKYANHSVDDDYDFM